MTTLRYLTAGESHGPGLTAILEGCPAGLAVDPAAIDAELGRRQSGYGRGERQRIEQDRVTVLGGVRHGKTTGAPVALFIANRDAANWGDILAVEAPATPTERVVVPRPGHADLGGALLYELDDIRDVIERASARETAARVACGAVAKALLAKLGCTVASHVVRIGDVQTEWEMTPADVQGVEASPVRCGDDAAAGDMMAAIDAATEAGDTLGGVIEVLAYGYPPGAGSYVQGDRRLRSRLAAAVLSVPAMVGVEFGLGFTTSGLPGSKVHDPIAYDAGTGYGRSSNRAGGIEGGISTGATIVLRVAMKPISTLREPLDSVEMGTHEPVKSRFERSDVCAVPAAGIVLEAVTALTLADAALERFGGATVGDLVAAIAAYRRRIKGR